eukprot:gene22574-1344_t
MSAAKKRVLLDHTPLNAAIEPSPLLLPLVTDLFPMFQKGDGVHEADLKLGFNHMRQHKSARSLAAIGGKGQAYELVSCQLGMIQVPKAFQELTGAVAGPDQC